MSRDSPDLSVGSKYIMPWAHLMHSVVRMGGKTTGSLFSYINVTMYRDVHVTVYRDVHVTVHCDKFPYIKTN
jgi:hypothetical protein